MTLRARVNQPAEISMTVSRREFIRGVAATAAACALPIDRMLNAQAPLHAAQMKFGYAAITWGGEDLQAIEEISAAGYRGIQLRATAVTRWADKPEALRDLLAQRKLTFAVLSSGNASNDPAQADKTIAEHVAHAKWMQAAGGQYLQLIEVRPPGPVTVEACTRLGKLLTEIGRRSADLGVPLRYHHHMRAIGGAPEDIDRVLSASDPKYVNLLLDTAHYLQGGGDPVAAIKRYRDRIAVMHLKDVETIVPTGNATQTFRFTELGRGRVDLAGVFKALDEISFSGWAIVELDSVAGLGHTPSEAAAFNKGY